MKVQKPNVIKVWHPVFKCKISLHRMTKLQKWKNCYFISVSADKCTGKMSNSFNSRFALHGIYHERMFLLIASNTANHQRWHSKGLKGSREGLRSARPRAPELQKSSQGEKGNVYILRKMKVKRKSESGTWECRRHHQLPETCCRGSLWEKKVYLRSLLGTNHFLFLSIEDMENHDTSGHTCTV